MEIVRRRRRRRPTDFRIRQLRARDMLRGDLEGEDLERYVEERVLTTTLDKALELGARQRDLPRHLRAGLLRDRDDVDRRPRAWTSRASASRRSAPRRARPTCSSSRAACRSRWRRSSGASTTRCSSRSGRSRWAPARSSMGVFNNYALVPADKFMPVDVHVPGCPPRPEALMHGILKLRDRSRHTRARAGASATARAAPRRSSAPTAAERDAGQRLQGGETPPVPDATGLELIAQELREADPDAVLDTLYFRERATLIVDPGRDARRCSSALRERGLRVPGQPCTASTTTPRSRASASTTSCSTWTSVDRITVKLRVPPTTPRGRRRSTPDWPDRRPPGARGLRHVRRRLRRPPGPAPDPDARGLRGPSRSGATSRSAASRSSSPTTRTRSPGYTRVSADRRLRLPQATEQSIDDYRRRSERRRSPSSSAPRTTTPSC